MPKVKPSTVKPQAIELKLTKWSFSRFGEASELDVFVESAGLWQTAAIVRAVDDFDAEEVASFITKAITTFLAEGLH